MQHILALHGGYVLQNYLKMRIREINIRVKRTSVSEDIRYVRLISRNILALVFIGKIQMFLVRDCHGGRAKYNSCERERPRSGGRSSIAATHIKVKCVIWRRCQLLGLHSYGGRRKISMEYGRKDNGSGRPKCFKINLSQCHYVHHQSNMKWARARRRATVMKDGD